MSEAAKLHAWVLLKLRSMKSMIRCLTPTSTRKSSSTTTAGRGTSARWRTRRARREGHNPLCGDKLTLYVKIDGDRIAGVSFEGSGCAISKASASLMTDAVKGQHARRSVRRSSIAFTTMVTTPIDQPVDDESLGKLAVLAGVREFPVRVKCASLAWHTLEIRACRRGRTGQDGVADLLETWTCCHNPGMSDASSPGSFRTITGRRFASAAEADRADLEYWRQMPAAERVLLVWQLSQEQWELSGQPANEPGLCRSVASLRRG